MSSGFLIAAPHSGSGKTVVTLGVMRALADGGVAVRPFKAGPDYIDPAFHAHAARQECFNLDPWAMRPELIQSLVAGEGPYLVEGMMGLFDGAADGSGSCADLAALLGLPVVLVVDCSRQSHSVAALVRGFRDHRKDVRIAALILNKVATARHERLLREALSVLDIPIAGVVAPLDILQLPERHLGLVQASEHHRLEAFVSTAATLMRERLDMEFLAGLKASVQGMQDGAVVKLPPLGQRIAIAKDAAFAFSYPHMLRGWQDVGAELSFFSPLANEAPDVRCDAVYLPGGYPELHAGTLAANLEFKAGMLEARERGAAIYGECGGYMVLGKGLVDADGTRHEMTGLLPVETSYEQRTRHLGYRSLRGRAGTLFPGTYRAHEFHYSTLVSQGEGEALFDAVDANGVSLGGYGIQIGRVAGSYMHLIDLETSA
ncbi:MAG: cobyrinate a,c-diamide synthase [Rhizobiaceae bacterium]